MNVRIRFLKAYLYNIALYECESWIIGENERKNIKAIKTWYCRRIQSKWIDEMNNNEVLSRIDIDRETDMENPKRKVRIF